MKRDKSMYKEDRLKKYSTLCYVFPLCYKKSNIFDNPFVAKSQRITPLGLQICIQHLLQSGCIPDVLDHIQFSSANWIPDSLKHYHK